MVHTPWVSFPSSDEQFGCRVEKHIETKTWAGLGEAVN